MKKLLIVVLGISLIIELALAVMCFFMPVTAFEFLALKYDETYILLGHIIAWFLLLVSSLLLYTIYCLIKNKDCSFLLYLLGIWWIFLGIGIYLKFGRPDNLFLDSLKGLVIIVLNYQISKDEKEKV